MFMWFTRPHLNIWQTLFFNFYFLPFKQARHLPIFIYGKLRLLQLEGKIVIDVEKVKKGMIHINRLGALPGASPSPGVFSMGRSTIIFKGDCTLAQGINLMTWGGGVLEFGESVYMAFNASISCCHKLIIGKHTRFSSGVLLTDTSWHFTATFPKLRVTRTGSPTVIGENCWIGLNAKILNGVVLPDHTTVSTTSIVNRRINSELTKPYTLIGGSPAKVLKEGFLRVFNKKAELEIARYFAQNPEEEYYQLEEPLAQYD